MRFGVSENKVIHIEGHDFLFLVADKAIFEMDPSTKEVLSRWSRKKEWTEEEMIAEVEGSPEEKKTFLQGLLKRRIITPLNSASPNEGYIRPETVSLPLKTIVLHVTDACNLGCLYCYYATGRQEPKKGPKRMSPETAQRAVDFLFEHSGNLDEVLLVFFGGEPLMNFELIKSVVSYAIQRASKKGKKVDFSITTNGTLLTPDIINFLAQNNFSVTVSIDGFKRVHDRYRRFPDGSPSYEMIIPKIRNLLQTKRERPPVARVTLVRTPDNVPEIFEHLFDLGFAEVGFAPVTTGNLEYQLDAENMDLLLRHFKILSGRFLENVKTGHFFGFSNLIDLLVSLHEDNLKNYPCGAGLGLFSVGPEGDLYLCQRFTGQDEFRMGDVIAGFDRTKVDTFRQEAQITQKEECTNCWVRTICTGGCYHEACVREGSFQKPNLHYCNWIRHWVGLGLEVYGRVAIQNPEYLEKLSMTRQQNQMVNHS